MTTTPPNFQPPRPGGIINPPPQQGEYIQSPTTTAASGYAPPQQPKKPTQWWKWLLIFFGAFVLAALLIIGTLASCTTALLTGAETTGDATVQAADEPTTEPSDPAEFTTSKDDWKVSLKTTDKECYGSAGCNVEVRVKLGYYGDSSQIPEDATIEVTYKIKGGDDGPVVGTTEVTNQGDYDVNTEMVSTRSRNSDLTVAVTDVEVY